MSFNEWKKYKLKDVCTKIGSGSTPRGGSSVYKEEGTTLIRSQNIYNNYFEYNGLAFIDDDAANKLKNVEIFENDVLINITGDSVARTTIVPKELLPARVNQHVCILRIDNEYLDPFYLKSFLVNSRMQEMMLSLAKSGGTRAALTKGMIENFEISVPPIEEQKAIAKILSDLDNKIEVNNKINQRLEEMAQSIFKHWFVDFEFPNEEGKPYKSSGGEMVESELGMIPKGWEVKELNELFTFKKGKKPKEILENKENENYKKYLTIDVLNQNSELFALSEKVVKCSEEDTLMVMDGASSGVIFTGMDGIVGSTLAKLEVKNSIFKSFIFQLLKFREVDIKSHLTGSAIPHADKNYIYAQKVALPNDIDLVNQLTETFRLSMKKNRLNNIETSKLKIVRDTLLPKLMSGEVRVPLKK